MSIKILVQNVAALIVAICALSVGFPSNSAAQAPLPFSATLPASVVKTDYAPTNKFVRLQINAPRQPADNWLAYDVFVTTNAAAVANGLDAINWHWLRRTCFGETNLVLTNLWATTPYFLLGTMRDSDGDSLADAFEMVVSKTNPNLRDSNNNEIADGDEMGVGGLPWILEQVRHKAAVVFASKATTTEGGACGQFTILLPEPAPAGGAKVQYWIRGTAVLGEEFTISPDSSTLVIPANANAATLSVCAVDNKAYAELDLYVEIRLTNCSSSPVFEYPAQVKIFDNDLPAVRVLALPPRLEEPSQTYGTNAGQFYFIRDGNGTNPATVNFSIGGTGRSGVNYVALPKAITFPANERTVSLRIMPVRDVKSYADRTVILTLTGAQGYQIDPTNSVAVVTIVNHDSPPLPVVQVAATIRRATVSTPGQFTFSRFGITNEALRVYYGVEGETMVAYQNGQPVISYRGLPGYVDIPTGQRTVTVPVVPVNPPPNGQTVTVTIRAAGDYSVGVARMAAVQIGKP